MKTDRFSSASTRAATVLLAGLLLAASLPAAGQTITWHFGQKTSTKALSVALARLVQEAQKRFKEDRRALRSTRDPNGEPAYVREEVAALIVSTETDLDQAIERVGEPGLDALRAWAAEELRRIQEQIAAPSRDAASLSDLFKPRAVAVIASLDALPQPGLVKVEAAPRQETISAETANRLLDQAGAVISRILVLAKKDDLEVELWVGSTPAPKTTFRFWSQGKVKGSTPAPTIVQTNGKRKRVLRGLYAYQAAWSKGAVTELVAYPGPAAASIQTERLDLVDDTSYFCCQFDKAYCHHVDDEKECRP